MDRLEFREKLIENITEVKVIEGVHKGKVGLVTRVGKVYNGRYGGGWNYPICHYNNYFTVTVKFPNEKNKKRLSCNRVKVYSRRKGQV